MLQYNDSEKSSRGPFTPWSNWIKFASAMLMGGRLIGVSCATIVNARSAVAVNDHEPRAGMARRVAMRETGRTSSPCVLVTEDEAAISLSLSDALEEAGYSVAGPFASSAAANTWLEQHTPDLALLDLMLRDGPCIALARVLHARSVPFALYTGALNTQSFPELCGVPELPKPSALSDIVRMVHRLRLERVGSAPAPSRPMPCNT